MRWVCFPDVVKYTPTALSSYMCMSVGASIRSRAMSPRTVDVLAMYISEGENLKRVSPVML